MLIVALYMNDLPVPSAQVIHPMPNGRFSWDGNLITVPSLITQCIHNPTPCCFIWASLTTSSKEYLRQFLQVSEVSSLSLHLSRHLVPSLLSLGNEVVASSDFPKALLTSGTWAKRSRLLPEPPRVWSLWGSLVGVYERPCPMLYLPWYLHLLLDKPAHVPCSLTTRSWRA